MWLAEILARNRQQRPGSLAVVDGERSLTWAELDARSRALAGALRERGVGPGGHVGVLSRNRLEVLESYFAASWLGAAFVPLNHALAAEELAEVTARVGVRPVLGEPELLDRTGLPAADLLAFDDPAYAAAVKNVPPADLTGGALDDPMAILLTSATTGRPKAVVQTHRAMMQMSLGWLAAVGAGPDTVLLNLNPLSHGSIQVTINYLTAGATVVLLRSFTPQGALTEIERNRVTHVWLVPQMLRFLLRARALDRTDTSSLREVLHGAAPISAALLREAGERLPCRFRNVYGMTEMGGPFATVSTGELVPDADGWPGGRGIPGLLVQVQDGTGAALPVHQVGEVCVRGPGMMREYWAEPEATAEAVRAGWLRTGDLGWMDERGYVYLVDRAKDMLIRGGQNVYPAEIERCLLQRPEVADAAVIGVPDEDWGESPVAYVVLRDGAPAGRDTAAALTRDLRGRLASYKVPTELHFVAEIPRNGAGKALKRVLRTRYAAHRPETSRS
jgi:acyl-CoA synthetase (AMP-forming)/AMP-acid ligase II